MKLKTKNGYEFEVDEEDVPLASQRGWWGSSVRQRRTNGQYGKVRKYIQRSIFKNGKWTSESLHRVILNAPDGADCDHVNGDGLDNRRNNLRFCTTSQNGANRGSQINNTAGFKGISWHKKNKNWNVRIMVHKKMKHLGGFSKKEDAAKAYNNAAIEYFGEFAKLNVL